MDMWPTVQNFKVVGPFLKSRLVTLDRESQRFFSKGVASQNSDPSLIAHPWPDQVTNVVISVNNFGGKYENFIMKISSNTEV